jgi:hypothetical protein
MLTLPTMFPQRLYFNWIPKRQKKGHNSIHSDEWRIYTYTALYAIANGKSVKTKNKFKT